MRIYGAKTLGRWDLFLQFRVNRLSLESAADRLKQKKHLEAFSSYVKARKDLDLEEQDVEMVKGLKR